ncbi:hypothetical protein Scep_019455 [Stephania cephalantha]|uniref:Uncharacterized protein n=1 Tax=Stephania cephalantha TaxID=152367 RepID=A0AAP0IAP7_9MAGN
MSIGVVGQHNLHNTRYGTQRCWQPGMQPQAGHGAYVETELDLEVAYNPVYADVVTIMDVLGLRWRVTWIQGFGDGHLKEKTQIQSA